MSGDKKRRRAASAAPWDGVPDDQLEPRQAIVKAVHEGIYGFRHEPFYGDIGFFDGYERDTCPHCGGPAVRNGFKASGLRRNACKACRRVFTLVTGTIFDNRKLPVTAWVDFILQAVSFESVAAMTREDRRADTTPPYWMAKLFAVRTPGDKPPGLSRNQMCIGVGVDGSGRVFAMFEVPGKPSKSRTWNAFGEHIEPGSTLLHNMEGTHAVLDQAMLCPNTLRFREFYSVKPRSEAVARRFDLLTVREDFSIKQPSRNACSDSPSLKWPRRQ